jgi:hypothetical protein
MASFFYRNRRIMLLKLCVACALTAAHFYPQSQFGLLVNLLWLFMF